MSERHGDSTGLKFPKPEKRKNLSHTITLVDALVSKIVRSRDKCCVTCGTTNDLTCSHWIPRRFVAVRFDLRNCNTQCGACNQAHSNDAIGTPLGEVYGTYMREHYGSGIMVELLRQKPRKLRRFEIERIHEELKAIAKEMGIV